MTIIDELIAVLGYEIKGADKLKAFQDSLRQTEEGANAVGESVSATTAAVDGLAPAVEAAGKAAEKGGESTKKFGKEIDGAGESATRSSSSINKMGLAAGAFTTAAIAVGTSALKNFSGFEREMTRIGITAGATASETAAAGDEVQRMAKQFALPLDQAVAGLDTLAASGMNLQQAMSFLPSVLATAQASGSATQDIANTIVKVSSGLKITAQDSQRAFDIMVAGGKAGQFELKDMALYIPTLASQMSGLGYSGEDGLRKLIALLQTLRERTGTSEAAATQLQNVLQKIYSTQTQNAFENVGVDLAARMKEARDNGEDAVAAFTRITRETMNGDMTLLPKLFADAQYQQGMLTLVTGADGMAKFAAALQNVDGTVLSDLNRVLGDTQASLDKTSSSLDRFWKALGGAISGPAGGTLDFLSNNLDYGEAIRKQLAAQGMGYWERENWMFAHALDGQLKDQVAAAGGYKGPISPPKQTIAVSRADYMMRKSNAAAVGQSVDAQSAAGTRNTSMADIESLIAASLSRIGGAGAAAPVVNDNRQDNRQFPVTVNTTVNQTVTQASDAPGAAANAAASAVSRAVQTPARQAAEPASTGWGGPR